MKQKRLAFRTGFRVAFGNRRAQAAVMVLARGGSENRHRGADQWLYVVAGSGSAIVNRRRIALTPGSLLLIEHGDLHEIRNTGRGLLKTVNVHAPPAYSPAGEELRAGKA